MQGLIFLLLIILGVGILLWIYFRFIKHLKINNVYLVTGGVKTGKSFVSVYLAVKYYKKSLRKQKFLNIFRRIFGKEVKQLPMLYSNIRLRHIKYNLLSLDILERKVRIPEKSVVLIDEVSLLADSQNFKDKLINEKLQLFVKLYGHYSHGGYLIVNTQALCDCHYAFKRCISVYLWIQNKQKWPFFTLLSVRELAHSEDNGEITNAFIQDTEKDNRPLFVWNKYYKYYDCFCYSIFTDNLLMKVDYDSQVLGKRDSLKTEVLVSLQDFQTLKGFIDKGTRKEKENENK